MNWPIVTLNEVTDLVTCGVAKKPDYVSEGIPFLSAKNVKKGNIIYSGYNCVSVQTHRALTKHNKPQKNDILYTRVGSVGEAAIIEEDIEFSIFVSLTLIKPKHDLIYNKYLKHLLNSEPFKARALGNLTGIGVGNLNVSVVREYPIPLPPLTEQKRIAAILDKADAIRRKRQQAIQLADDFLRAVFLDMFGDPVINPKGWEPATLGDLIHFAKDGPHVSPKYSEVGIPFLSTRHVKPTGIVWKDLKYITPEEADIHWKKCKPTLGDILYTKGGTTGIACAVDFEKDFAVWVHVALLRPKSDKVNYVWLTHMLNSKYCYQQSQRYTRGATNKDLGLKRMIDIEMYCPPIDEQNKFVEVKNRIDGLINKGHSFAKSDLFGSLSQKAFQGEL